MEIEVTMNQNYGCAAGCRALLWGGVLTTPGEYRFFSTAGVYERVIIAIIFLDIARIVVFGNRISPQVPNVFGTCHV